MAVSRTEHRTSAAEAGAVPAGNQSTASLPLVGRFRDRVSQELNTRKDRASEVLDTLAGTVRRVGEPLHDESLGPLGGYADEAAERLERLATNIREHDVAELADDLRGVARQRPVAFAAVGFAAGLMAARFLKSTAGDQPVGRNTTGGRSRGARAQSAKAGATGAMVGSRVERTR
jgi:hypothetical protein